MIRKQYKPRRDKGQPRKYYAGRPCKSHVVFEDCSSSIKYEDLEKYIGKHVEIGPNHDTAVLDMIDDAFIVLSNVKGWHVSNCIAAVAFPRELKRVNKEKFQRGWWITNEKDFKELGGIFATESVQSEETVCSDDKDVITFLKEITQILKDINDRI